MGYNREDVIYFDIEKPSEAFISEIKNLPEVINVGGGNLVSGKKHGGTNGLSWQGKDPNNEIFFSTLWMSYDLIETLNMEVVEGKSFSRDFGSPNQAILNEKAITLMGIDQPVGKMLSIDGEERQIIGVVQDFHFESYYEEMKPCVLLLAPMQYAPRLSIRIQGGRERETI